MRKFALLIAFAMMATFAQADVSKSAVVTKAEDGTITITPVVTGDTTEVTKPEAPVGIDPVPNPGIIPGEPGSGTPVIPGEPGIPGDPQDPGNKPSPINPGNPSIDPVPNPADPKPEPIKPEPPKFPCDPKVPGDCPVTNPVEPGNPVGTDPVPNPVDPTDPVDCTRCPVINVDGYVLNPDDK